MNVRKSLLGLLFLLSMNVSAATPQWTDLWWNPNESGWGVNLVQQNESLFMTFFIYDQSTDPYWVVASLAPQSLASESLTPEAVSSGFVTYSGTVYASQGPWFGGAFDPTKVTQQVVGSITFAPLSATQATLTYSVNGVTVAKAIQRESFTHIPLAGSYQGGYSVEFSSCPSLPPGHFGIIQLLLNGTINADGLTGSIQTTLSLDLTGDCALSGAYLQSGSIYTVSNLGSCSTPASFGSYLVNYTTIAPTSQGLEGEITLAGSGCAAIARFGTVLVN